MRVLVGLLIGASVGVMIALLLEPQDEVRYEPGEEEEWDIVDEASAESFPASDSPAY